MELKYPLWFLEIDEYEIPHIVNKGITTKMLCLYVILMCLILAWVKWKGVAHDAHIFLKALRRQEGQDWVFLIRLEVYE